MRSGWRANRQHSANRGNMKRSGDFRLNTFAEYSELYCPVCQGPNIHQGRVAVFQRGEDGVKTFQTIVSGEKADVAVVDSSQCANPSSRRQGLRIEFDCENCHSREPNTFIALTISQHKGFTELSWEFG